MVDYKEGVMYAAIEKYGHGSFPEEKTGTERNCQAYRQVEKSFMTTFA